MTAATCTRRPYSVWTGCTCPPCRTETARLSKLARNGHYRRVPSDAAWEVIEQWDARGWSGKAMASAAGLPPRTIESALTPWRATGKRRRFGPRHAQMIVAGRDNEPTAGQVGALGSQRRLQALAVQGYGLQQLANATGEGASTLAYIRLGTTTRISARRAATITRVYQQFAGRYGGDELAAVMAREKGWHSALAWDDPDDPDEQPEAAGVVAITPGGPTKRTHITEIGWLIGQHPAITTEQLANRIGVTPEAIERRLRRAGRTDLLDKLTRNTGAVA